MKRIFIITVLCYISILNYAQQIESIDSIKFIPINPNNVIQTQIVIFMKIDSWSIFNQSIVNTNLHNIEINEEFSHFTLGGIPTTYIDTVNVGFLPAANYNLKIFQRYHFFNENTGNYELKYLDTVNISFFVSNLTNILNIKESDFVVINTLGKLTIDLSQRSDIISMDLLNINGIIIRQKKIISDKLRYDFDTENINTGIYFLRINRKENTICKKIFIIN